VIQKNVDFRKRIKIADLPPAAVLAMASLQSDGRVKIHLRYVVLPRDKYFVWIGQEEDYFGVPFQKWCENLGKVIRLWEWHGTGPGMIGGPVKRPVGTIWWGGAAEFPLLHSNEECLQTATRLEKWLADTRYEFSDLNREDILDKIYRLRMPREWQAANRFHLSPSMRKFIREEEERERNEQ
jgi:hypothetical protein